MKRAIALTASIAVLASVGCRHAASNEAQAEQATAVKVTQVESATLVERARLSGRVVPLQDRDALLSSPLVGRVAGVEVRDGDAVLKGQVLARLEPAPLDDVVTAAEASARQAEADVTYKRARSEKTRTLVDRGVAAQQDADADAAEARAAESARAQADLALADARRRRQWADVRAPFDGVVLHVLRRAGETVDGSSAMPIIEVASPTPVEIAADAPAATLVRVQPGAAAEVAVAGSGPGPVAAHVVRIARAVDGTTGTGELRLAPDDPAAALMLGASVEVRIVLSRRDGVLSVPVSAIRREEDGGSSVVVVDQGVAHVRPVTTGLRDGDRVEIVSGLAAGESVVAVDPLALAEGTRVTAAP